jgi:HEAT repeat protein
VLYGFIRALHAPNPLVRQLAAQLLGKSGDTRIVPHLLDRLNKENEFVQITIVESLATLNDNQAINVLQSLLKQTKSTALQQSILAALVKLNVEASR